MTEVEIELIASRIRNDMRKRIEFCDNVGITLDDYYVKQCGDFEIEDMIRAYENGKIADEEENNKLLDVINNQDVKIADLEKQNEQAKKIIKNLCNTVRALNNPNTELTDVKGYLSEAEQFLKEIEK